MSRDVGVHINVGYALARSELVAVLQCDCRADDISLELSPNAGFRWRCRRPQACFGGRAAEQHSQGEMSFHVRAQL